MDIIPVYADDDSGILGYYAKGHLSKEDFANACERYLGEPIGASDVHHDVWRRIPIRNNWVVEGRFIKANPGKGAFEVTFISKSSNWDLA